MKIAVVGMGLIGGSLCRAFHHYTTHKVLGTTRNHKTVEFALSVGAIDEELTRLECHFGAFRDILASGEPCGRKLDFLLQEINRETNTIGSKAQCLEIAKRVVHIKAELEKIREQIQNIE